jgi:hypothetical protein
MRGLFVAAVALVAGVQAIDPIVIKVGSTTTDEPPFC